MSFSPLLWLLGFGIFNYTIKVEKIQLINFSELPMKTA